MDYLKNNLPRGAFVNVVQLFNTSAVIADIISNIDINAVIPVESIKQNSCSRTLISEACPCLELGGLSLLDSTNKQY